MNFSLDLVPEELPSMFFDSWEKKPLEEIPTRDKPSFLYVLNRLKDMKNRIR